MNSQAQKFQIQLNDLPFKNDIINLGGKLFSVGGVVRDKFLGKESKDLDILITGIPMDILVDVLGKHGKVDSVGKSFGVIKFKQKGSKDDIDIAIPRTELPTGTGGHKGFDVKSDHLLPIEKDLERRDFTINAIAEDINGKFIDPFNGISDLNDKIIRVVNPDAFSDDPLRMLRAVQFASRFDFTIEQKTMDLIINNRKRIKEIAGERIIIELDKIINKGNCSLGGKLLKSTGLFNEIFEYELDDSLINDKLLENVQNIGEYIFLLTRDSGNSENLFKDKFKGDNDNFDLIKSLKILFDNNSDNVGENRKLLSMSLSVNPNIFNSKIIPDRYSQHIDEFINEKYPKSLKDLAINGNHLIDIGLKGKDIGDSLKMLLFEVYNDNIENNKKDLLDKLSNSET